MLDYKDIKMCISYMEREDSKEEVFIVVVVALCRDSHNLMIQYTMF